MSSNNSTLSQLNSQQQQQQQPSAEQTSKGALPSALLFGSTVRWLEQALTIVSSSTRLTRRGKLFGNIKPRAPSLGRMLKDVRLTVSLDRFQIHYWSSVSRRHGIHLLGGRFTHSSAHAVNYVRPTTIMGAAAAAASSDHGVTNVRKESSSGHHSSIDHRRELKPLIRRTRANWRTIYMNSELANVEIYLHNNQANDRRSTASGSIYDEQQQQNQRFENNDLSSGRQYFLSLSRMSYTKDEMAADVGVSAYCDSPIPSRSPVRSQQNLISGESTVGTIGDDQSTDDLTTSAAANDAHLAPNHRVCIHDLKGAWTRSTRDVVLGIVDAFVNSQRLKRNLSTDALRPLRPSQVRPLSVSKSRAFSMLHRLIADSENNPSVYTEETLSGVSSQKNLYGVEACQQDNVVYLNCLIELVNSQVMLRGCETSGYVIVSAADTCLRQRIHVPVWKDRRLLSKVTWIGELRSMQYYATDGTQDPNHICWLDSQIQLQRIISRCACVFYLTTHTEGVHEQLVDLVPPPLAEDEMFIEPWDKEVGVDSFTLTHQGLEISTNSEQYAMIMDIVNNLLLYIEPHKKSADEKLERMRFQFALASDDDVATIGSEQRQQITRLQDEVRRLVSHLRRLERREPPTLALDEIRQCKERVASASEELAMMISCYREMQLGAYKATQRAAAANLYGYHTQTHHGAGGAISSSPMSMPMSTSSSAAAAVSASVSAAAAAAAADAGLGGALYGSVVKRCEISFANARWRMTDSDGQLGLADIVLREFLYSKVAKDDDSVEHTIELGHLNVSNLIQNQQYKQVLHPTELQANIPLDRQRALRIYCRELAPVAGISVKEHLEVNVVPFTINVTLVFFQKMLRFFFPPVTASLQQALMAPTDAILLDADEDIEGTNDNEFDLAVAAVAAAAAAEDNTDSIDTNDTATTDEAGASSLETESLISSQQHAMLNNNKESGSIGGGASNNGKKSDDVEKMRERAAKNHTFVHVKIPGIPVRVSYKGKKQKSVTDLKNVSLTLPTFEYHNATWTWLDLLLAVKNDSKTTVIKQALKQKMRSLGVPGAGRSSANSSAQQQSPDIRQPASDADKARILLGACAHRCAVLRTTN